MTGCILSGIMCARPDDDGAVHEAEPGRLVCWGAQQRLAAALRDIPVLVDELAGGGYVERDTRPGTRAVRVAIAGDPAGRTEIVRVPAMADPAANLLPAGPINGRSGAPRVAGTGERSLPIRVDPTDLTMPARVFRLAGRPPADQPREPCRFCREHHVPDLHPPTPAPEPVDRYADQVGYLSVATELEFWARDWADERRERSPYPTVRCLAGWLLDRLDWACARHHALDEFAEKLRTLRSALTAAAGRSEPRPEVLEAPCPDCGQLALYRDTDLVAIACGACPVLLSEEGYAEHVNKLIEEAS